MTTARSSTKTVVENVVLKIPLKKLFFFAVDVSRSMKGSRLTQALRCIHSLILGEACTDTDRFALIAFNSEVHAVTPRHSKQAKKISSLRGEGKWSAVAEKVSSIRGKGTCLWGAVSQAMDDLENMPRENGVHVNLVVLTDGEDNKSERGSVDVLEARIAKPGMANFHVIFLACCGASTADMRHIAANKNHVRVIEEASPGSDSIAKAFGRAQQALLERRSTTVTTHCGSHSSSFVSTTATQECNVTGLNGKAVAGLGKAVAGLTNHFGGMAVANGSAPRDGRGRNQGSSSASRY
jgi:hypothetical protein